MRPHLEASITVKSVSNLAASVQAHLQNHARRANRPFQELLQYYAMERFLYRLSTSPHRTRFVLKGAMMLHVWEAPLARATKDLDFLGRMNNSLENLERVVRELCTADVEPDGMVFDPATVKTERIMEDADYLGDGRLCVVHLTWNVETDPRWPRSEVMSVLPEDDESADEHKEGLD